MELENTPNASEPPPKRQKRKCGVCGAFGHDKRNCPKVSSQTSQNEEQNQPPDNDGAKNPPPNVTPLSTVNNIDFNEVFYFVFDLETTGFSRETDEIIEISSVLLSPDGIQIEDATFTSFCKPSRAIPTFVTALTSITNEMVQCSPVFSEVIEDLLTFVDEKIDDYNTNCNKSFSDVILVAHNGRNFDIPFLVSSIRRCSKGDLLQHDLFTYYIDTMELAKRVGQKRRSVPSNYKLNTLHQFVTGEDITNAHRAYGDVLATCIVFRHEIFWEERKESVKTLSSGASTTVHHRQTSDTNNNNDDSDFDVDDNDADDNNSNSSSDSEMGDENLQRPAAGDKWFIGKHFEGVDAETAFNNVFATKSTRGSTGTLNTGLQVSVSSVNSPAKAWRQIFTSSILDKIVSHTNAYGNRNAKHWSDIDRQDLLNFFAVLFVSSVQKRKDRPDHWFSDDKVLENPFMKRIMSGRKFFIMMRYLHVCSLEENDSNANKQTDDYDPAYKVKELITNLETRYKKLFIPGRQLSLDETLLRAFGRIKFKVRIVTKAARYGIKLYVVTDALTAFVHKVMVYTGKYTYKETEGESIKKTVSVVKQLVADFEGTHRTVYVDRFYTSIDLIKELHDMNLYVTGTCMNNRIPKAVNVPQSSDKFKQMERGSHTANMLRYVTKSKRIGKAGIVCWKDKKMVYCLSNETTTSGSDQCKRRTKGGIIEIDRPKMITSYNKYMGGVDLADMRRLHCSSTIMGHKRWWLKLFFYLLDVGTSNALVLYKQAMKEKANKMTIVKFKTILIESFVGNMLKEVPQSPKSPKKTHQPVRVEGRHRCAHCALYSMVSRTRYICDLCGIPLCCSGNGRRVTSCFSAAHENETILNLVTSKAIAMQVRTNKKGEQMEITNSS